jgi:iron complex outermembrane receptor protein
MITPVLLVCMAFSMVADTARKGDTTGVHPEGLGTNGSYYIKGGYGQFAKADAGINLNHRSKSLDVAATASYSFDKSYSLITSKDGTNQFPIDFGKGVRTYQFYQESTPSKHRIYAGLSLDYQADKNTVVGVTASVSRVFNHLQGYTNSSNNIYGDSVLNQNILNGGKEDLVNAVTEINVDKVLSKNKKLGFNFAYIRRSDYNLPIDHYTFLNKEGSDVSHSSETFYTQQKTLTRTGIDIFSGKGEYSQKLDSALYLVAGLSFSDSRLASTIDAQGLKDGVWNNNYGISGKVTLEEPVGELYSSLRFDKGRYRVVLGLSYKYVRRDLQSGEPHGDLPDRYGELLPSLMVRKTLSSAARLIIRYDRGFKLPEYVYIASNVNFNGIYGFSIGNPFLQPVVSNNVSALLQYKDFQFSLDGRRDEKAIAGFQQSESPTGNLFYITSQNMAWSEGLYAEAELPFQLAPWLRWTNDLVGSWNRFRADPKPSRSFVTSVLERSYFGYEIESRVNLSLPHQFFIGVTGSYHSGYWSGGYNLMGAGGVSLVISKRFRDNSSLQLSVSDLFRTNYTHEYLNAPELAYHIHSNISFIPESKRAELVTVTWRKSLGSDKVQSARNWGLTSGNVQNR